MVKFNNAEFKLKVVLEYLSGATSTSLNDKYGIKGSATVLGWVHNYQTFGLKGITVKQGKTVYSVQYKIKVLNWMISHKTSFPETALHFNITSPALIFAWERRSECKNLNINKSYKINDTHMKNIKQCLKILKYLIKNKFKSLRYEYHHSIAHCVRTLNHRFKNVALSKILSLINVPKSSYYYHSKLTLLPKDHQDIISNIKDIKHNNPAYGYRRVTLVLKNEGRIVNHKLVLKLMKGYDLTSNFFNKKSRKYDSYKGLVGKIAPNRFHRKFKTDRPYQKLVTDVSEFRYGSKSTNERVYLSPVMDLYYNEILFFNISSHPTVSFTLKSLKDALEPIHGEGHRNSHSD